MNKKMMQRWVKALFSGKYKQAKGTLAQFKDTGSPVTGEQEACVGHCCLGVLSRVNGKSDADIRGDDLLSDDMQETAGIRTEDGKLLDKNGEPVKGKPIRMKVWNKKKKEYRTRSFESLADANDSGINFRKIGRWIEKNYRNL